MDFFKEHLCFFCLQTCPLGQGFCEFCMTDFMWMSQQPCCIQCGIFITAGTSRCGACVSRPPEFDYSCHLLCYDDHAGFLLKRFKYYNKLNILDWLSPYMVQAIQNHPIRLNLELPRSIIPVPLHTWRLIRRGFNQSTCLARKISQSLKIPLLLGQVKKNKSTPQQAKLKMKDRYHNIAGAFSINPIGPHLEHVAIVDDLMTTGATINEIAKLLKQECGTKIVEAWTLMRAL